MASVALIILAVLAGRQLLRRHHARPKWRTVATWFGVAALLALATLLSPGAFELRKFVGACLMPAGLAWLGLLALARALAAQGRRGFAAATLGIWLLLTLAGNVWLGTAALGWLQRGYAALDPLQQGSFDAVVVLGGGVDVDDNGEPTLTASGGRVVLAVRLYRAGRTGLLVATGPFVPLAGRNATSAAAATATIWSQLGVPEASIVALSGSRSTTDEVLTIRKIAAERGWRRVGLLTSAWHMRRATKLCRRYGVGVTALPADAVRMPRAQLRWVVPQEIGFQRVQTACWELLGSLAGR